MAAAAALELPYPEVARIAEDSLDAQSAALAAALPERPVVLGGCCCAHVGAVEGLARRGARLGLVWLDAHGDLNTPETSPSGNLWGMPLRMILDGGAVATGDAVLVGARNLDPGEEAFIRASALATGSEGVTRALDGVEAVYLAIDVDVLEPGEPVAMHMAEPGGLRLGEVEELIRTIAARRRIAGVGLSGLAPGEGSVAGLVRLLAAAGL
jgi:arginase